MQKLKMIIIITTFATLFCTLSSCKKTWLCEEPMVYLTCIKGTDTIYTNIGPATTAYYSQSYVDNLVIFYTAQGYTVNKGENSTAMYVTGKATVKLMEDNGVYCQ